MARIRTVKPEFWSDEAVGALSPNSRLLFIASWSLADDEGLLVWTAAFLRAQVFAYDDLTLDQVGGHMSEITAAGFVHQYQDDKGRTFGWIVNFRKHQKIDKPQPPKHPLPSLQNADVRRRYAQRDGWRCQVCGEEIDPAASANKKRLSLDHIYPQARGGIDAPSNIRIAHFGCNASKRDRPLDDKSGNGRELSSTEGKGREGKGEDQGKDQGEDGGAVVPSSPELFANGATEPPQRVRLVDMATWEPDDPARQYASRLMLDPDRVKLDIRAWAANAPPSKRRKRDPLQFWQTWCRKDADDPRKRRPTNDGITPLGVGG